MAMSEHSWPIEKLAKSARGKYQTARRLVRAAQERGYIEEVEQRSSGGRPKSFYSLTATGKEARDFQLSRVAAAMPMDDIHDVFPEDRYDLQYNIPSEQDTEVIAEALHE